MVDPTSIESSETIEQLRVDARQLFVKVSKSAKKTNRAKWEKKIENLEELFRTLHQAEAVYQKLKYKYVELMSAIALKMKEESREDPQKGQQIDFLISMLVKLDKEQAIERRKANDMQRWIRGNHGRITNIKNQTTSSINRTQKQQQTMIKRMEKREILEQKKQAANANERNRKAA